MAYFPLLKSGAQVGLDIGDHAIKAVLLKRARKGNFFAKAVVKRIPGDFRIGQGSDDQVGEWIRELLKAVGFKGSRLVSIISGTDLNVRCISLPSMPQRELREAVKWEVGKYLSFPAEEAKIEYWELGQTKSDGTEQVHLLVSALRKAEMHRLTALLKKAGIQSPLFIPIAEALWNVFQRTKEDISQEIVGLIDLGATRTYILIIRGGILQFIREIPLGGGHITEAIVEVINPDEKSSVATYEAAERMKEKWGIPEGVASNGEVNGVSPERVFVAMRPILEKLLTEIDRSFEFYKQQYNESTLERVFLCGGTAKLANLKEYLASGLGLPVEGFQSLFEVSYDGDGKMRGLNPELTAAFGAALEKRSKWHRGIRSIRDLRRKIILMPLMVVLGMTVLMGMYWSVDNRYRNLRRAVEKKKILLTQLETQMGQIDALREKREKLKKELSLYPIYHLKQPPYPDILAAISHLIPGNVTLNLLLLNEEPGVEEEKEGKGYRLKIRGVIFGEGPNRIATMARLMASLEKSPFFEDVKLLSTAQNDEYSQPGDEFDLSCLYRNGEANVAE